MSLNLPQQYSLSYCKGSSAGRIESKWEDKLLGRSCSAFNKNQQTPKRQHSVIPFTARARTVHIMTRQYLHHCALPARRQVGAHLISMYDNYQVRQVLKRMPKKEQSLWCIFKQKSFLRKDVFLCDWPVNMTVATSHFFTQLLSIVFGYRDILLTLDKYF